MRAAPSRIHWPGFPGWDVPLIVVTARLRCSNCYAKDCEIQVDGQPPLRLVTPPQGSVPKRLL